MSAAPPPADSDCSANPTTSSSITSPAPSVQINHADHSSSRLHSSDDDSAATTKATAQLSVQPSEAITVPQVRVHVCVSDSQSHFFYLPLSLILIILYNP